jgi:hypothetical protein
VKVNLDEEKARKINELVINSRYMFELDMSYNHIKPIHMAIIVNAVAQKKSL